MHMLEAFWVAEFLLNQYNADGMNIMHYLGPPNIIHDTISNIRSLIFQISSVFVDSKYE